MYQVVTGLLEKMHWMLLKQVALATDGASSITGHRTGLVARMRAESSNFHKCALYCTS